MVEELVAACDVATQRVEIGRLVNGTQALRETACALSGRTAARLAGLVGPAARLIGCRDPLSEANIGGAVTSPPLRRPPATPFWVTGRTRRLSAIEGRGLARPATAVGIRATRPSLETRPADGRR